MSDWIIAPQANGDWDAIWHYWVDHAGLDAAERLRTEFVEGFKMLADRPMIGHKRSDVRRPVRFWDVRDYLVVYWPEAKPLEILRLAYGAQDIPRIVREIS